MWFADEARIGQKNSLTRVWGQTGSRPVAPKDLGFTSAYVFGAVCPSEGKAAALTEARPSGDNAFKIELARRIVVRALILATAGTPERVAALPASPFAPIPGGALHV